MKKILRQLKKIFLKQHKDYSYGIYFLRVSSFLLTWVYAACVMFNKKKRIKFHANQNFIRRLYLNKITKYDKTLNNEFNKKFFKNGKYEFNSIFLPKIDDITTLRFIYEDVLSIYTEKNDDYSYKIVEQVEKNSTEGPFCYLGSEGEDITIHKGDVVIDAGAWIGDFSAYCAKKEAFAYAFEPTPSTVKVLEKTIDFNKAKDFIKIIPFGLGDREDVMKFDDNNLGSANSFNKEGRVQIKIITLDNWVKENNVKQINFIKADIEGYERNMLLGAQEVLKKFQPTLSICTYHLPDDPEVLEKIILDANPNYKIIQRKMKLFAYIPNKKI